MPRWPPYVFSPSRGVRVVRPTPISSRHNTLTASWASAAAPPRNAGHHRASTRAPRGVGGHRLAWMNPGFPTPLPGGGQPAGAPGPELASLLSTLAGGTAGSAVGGQPDLASSAAAPDLHLLSQLLAQGGLGALQAGLGGKYSLSRSGVSGGGEVLCAGGLRATPAKLRESSAGHANKVCERCKPSCTQKGGAPVPPH